MVISVLAAKNTIRELQVPEGQRTVSRVLDLGGINVRNLEVMRRLGAAQVPPVKVTLHGPNKIKISCRAK